ncbi:MAG: hypothetical protein IPM74_14350 [Crocinitomicaceae bacterium]|nr:hypothetical protein [Crocinitomicaceae bacterium]MBK8927050.1 hypothetical protein [Crocinitomicaceae bacterium]
MKYKITIGLTLILISFKGMSQFTKWTPTDIAALKKSTLYVVMYENSGNTALDSFCTSLKSSMESEWYFSEFEFINYKEVGSKIQDPNNYFIDYLFAFRTSTIEGGGVGSTSTMTLSYLQIFRGEEVNENTISQISDGEIAYFTGKDNFLMPLRALSEFHLYEHEMGFNLRMIQDFLKRIEKGENFSPKHAVTAPSPLQVTLHDEINMNEKILIIQDKFIQDRVDKSFIESVYPFPFEILTSDEISEKIKSEDPTYCLLRNSRCGTYNLSMIVQLSDARTIGFFEKHNFWIYYSGPKKSWYEKAFKIMFKDISKSYGL